MAFDRTAPHDVPPWSRLLEWSLVAGVIVVLVLVFARQVQVLRGQAELAAVKSTLGALRTALVLDHLRRNVAGSASSVAVVQHNPFELLQRPPANYRGEMEASAAASAPAGSWVFDPICVCAGYLPFDAQWLDSPNGDFMAWYRITGAPGPLQLAAKEAYVWQGQTMN